MSNKDIINAAQGYLAGNAIAKGVINDLKKTREEIQQKLAHYTSEEALSAEVAKFILANNKQGAFEYLNSHFNEEIVDAAQRQNDFIYSLETLLKKRKDKYMPFYTRIGMDMPEQLRNITADQLCEILGVENLHIIDSVDGKTSPSKPKEGVDFGLIFRAVIIIGLVVLMIVLSLS